MHTTSRLQNGHDQGAAGGADTDPTLARLLRALEEHGATLDGTTLNYHYNPGIGPAVVPVALPAWVRALLVCGVLLQAATVALLVVGGAL